jgi:hypothetical protein
MPATKFARLAERGEIEARMIPTPEKEDFFRVQPAASSRFTSSINGGRLGRVKEGPGAGKPGMSGEYGLTMAWGHHAAVNAA